MLIPRPDRFQRTFVVLRSISCLLENYVWLVKRGVAAMVLQFLSHGKQQRAREDSCYAVVRGEPQVKLELPVGGIL